MQSSLTTQHMPLTARGHVDGRSARKVETRRRIVTAASELFAEQGFSGTSMDQIAQAAGVSKGTIFYNFKNKSELFAHLVREAACSIADEINRARQERRGWDALQEALLVLVQITDHCPANAQILVSELFRTQRPWSESLADSRDVLLAPLVEILEEMADDRTDPGVRRLASEAERSAIAMSLVGAVMIATMDRVAFTPQRSLEAVHALLVRAISAVAQPSGSG
ncbi:TetR/AcrR family transcriptional regulator [Luteococcus sp. OSA5]|uniref:TetR/AcrR family transcriptional regulator n=1 Tax=Luteococcus sp. OSA5 TaxID=3401630 RepID=UPI003B42F73F